MEDVVEGNARIAGTMLGYEDHGILTCSLMLQGDGWGQGFGGLALDAPGKDGRTRRMPHSACGQFIAGLLWALDAKTYESLDGQLVRFRREGGANGKIVAIGHLLKSQWFYPEKEVADN